MRHRARRYLEGGSRGTEETTFQGDHRNLKFRLQCSVEASSFEKFNQAAAAARLPFGAAAWLALTAVVVIAWKLASATSAACLAALCTLS